jgi:hypothetical protein
MSLLSCRHYQSLYLIDLHTVLWIYDDDDEEEGEGEGEGEEEVKAMERSVAELGTRFRVYGSG